MVYLEEWEKWAFGPQNTGSSLEVPQLVGMGDTNRRLNMFGFSTEYMDMLLMPMGVDGKEALGSMGNDAPLAVLSHQPKPPSDYFKQLFAQVTNPPIDPIRESMVMTLKCPVGPEANLLTVGPEQCKRLTIEHPVLTMRQLQTVKDTEFKGWRAKTLDATFPATMSGSVNGTMAGGNTLEAQLEALCQDAAAAVSAHTDSGEGGFPLLVISDRLAGPGRYPIPSLLALGAVHQHLVRTQQRARTALIVEAGDAREVHDFATLLGFGADGICPYMAYEALVSMNGNGLVAAKAGREMSDEEVIENYRTAAGKGLLKVMAKMGVSTLQGYKGAQVFEAVGLGPDIVDLCFTGTDSRLMGVGFDNLLADIIRNHAAGYPRAASGMHSAGM